MTNAIVHAYRDTIGEIYISVELIENSIVRIKVKDKGCGISDVKCARVQSPPVETLALPEERAFFVASERADAVIAAIYGFSRSECQKLFGQKLVFIDSRLCLDADARIPEGAVVSVRGSGRFIYTGIAKTTKKGRLCIGARVY